MATLIQLTFDDLLPPNPPPVKQSSDVSQDSTPVKRPKRVKKNVSRETSS